MSGLASFEITASPTGDSLVSVNGELVENLVGLNLQTRPGQLPVLVLHLAGEGTITGEGIVEVPVHGNPSEIILRFLESISVQDLEQEVLSDPSLEASPIGVALSCLMRRAHGVY